MAWRAPASQRWFSQAPPRFMALAIVWFPRMLRCVLSPPTEGRSCGRAAAAPMGEAKPGRRWAILRLANAAGADASRMFSSFENDGHLDTHGHCCRGGATQLGPGARHYVSHFGRHRGSRLYSLLDIARATVCVLRHLLAFEQNEIFNVASGQGTSVAAVIGAARKSRNEPFMSSSVLRTPWRFQNWCSRRTLQRRLLSRACAVEILKQSWEALGIAPGSPGQLQPTGWRMDQ